MCVASSVTGWFRIFVLTSDTLFYYSSDEKAKDILRSVCPEKATLKDLAHKFSHKNSPNMWKRLGHCEKWH